MRRLSWLALIAGAFFMETARAEAAVISGDAAIATIATLGTLGGITTSISAAVYAADERAFGNGWIVASLFSAAICFSIGGSMLKSATSEGGGASSITGLLFFFTLAAWPGYWTVKSAISDVDPGERFEAAVVAQRPTADPSSQLDDRTQPRAASIMLPPLAFRF